MKRILSELFRLRRRSLIAIAALVLINVILYADIAIYQTPALDNARRSWGSLRDRVMALGRGDVTATYRQGKTDLEKIRTMIPVKRDFPRILGDIMDTAASSGVTMGSVSYKPRTIKEESLLAYAVIMTVNGSYAGIKSFLADLQQNRELVVIDAISLSNGDPYEENVSMELRLTVYLREGA